MIKSYKVDKKKKKKKTFQCNIVERGKKLKTTTLNKTI